MLLGLLLRLWNIDYPPWKSSDEQDIIARALLIGHQGPNPGWFINPSLFLYVLFAIDAIVYLGGWFLGVFGSRGDFATFYFAYPLVFHLIGRGAALVCGMACLAITFHIGRRWWGTNAGLGATALLAVSPLFVSFSRSPSEKSPQARFGHFSGRLKWWIEPRSSILSQL